MERLLVAFLLRYVRRGSLKVTTAAGDIYRFGDGSGPPVAVRFTTASAQCAVLLDPELKLGEAYMDGTFIVERGSIAEVLAILFQQDPAVAPRWAWPTRLIRYLFRRLQQFNPRTRAQRNVAHHYDLDGRLYSLFLDGDQQYSCAYFESADVSLDDAQLAKKRHLAAKLRLDPGATVLDIGCGWGGLVLYLTEMCGARATGITLSQEQYRRAQARALERGRAQEATFRLIDYRDVEGRFDRIVSVGMFEHVGVGFYDTYFNKCVQLLKDDGVALLALHRPQKFAGNHQSVDRQIYLSRAVTSLRSPKSCRQSSARGFIVTDIEVLQLHYAETLKAWRERFLAHRDEVERLYDQRFVRMWEFYLACSEMAFRDGDMVVFQIQMAKRKGVAPATRDYIAHEEARLRRLEAGQPHAVAPCRRVVRAVPRLPKTARQAK